MTFNGVSLFANTSNSGDQSVFKSDSTSNTVSIHTSTQGSQGSKISLHKAALLAALTLEVGDLKGTNNVDAVYDPAFGSLTGQIGGEMLVTGLPMLLLESINLIQDNSFPLQQKTQPMFGT